VSGVVRRVCCCCGALGTIAALYQAFALSYGAPRGARAQREKIARRWRAARVAWAAASAAREESGSRRHQRIAAWTKTNG